MLETVAIFRDPWEAHMLRMRLEAEGMPAFVAYEFHIGNNWLWSTALGGVRVQVWHHLAKDAWDVWQRCRNGEFRHDLVAEFGDIDDPHCPHCGSTELKKRRSVAMIALVVAALFILSMPAWGWVYVCKKCGTKFELL
jgi:DNA-directed RNA polymerase subunit RPC12/RpoP